MREAEIIAMSGVRRMEGTFAQSLGRMSSTMGQVGHGLTRTLTIPILGIGAASAKMAIDFQAAMENMHTQAGASQKEVDKLSQQVLALAKTVPYGPTPLADALYHLESIGLRLNKQFEQQGIQVRKQIPLMQVLKTAAEGAAVGHSDLEQTTTALGSAWLSGIRGATDLKTAMGTLNAIVGTGNMRMNDLVSALGTGVLPMAKLAGLGLKDVGAALAIMSDEGYNVTSAATQMGTALHYLFDPTQKASTALQQIGLHTGELAGDMHKPRGLLTALTDLKQHLDTAFPASSGHALSVAQTTKAVDTFQTSLEKSGVSGKKLTDAVEKYRLKLKELGSAEVAQESVLGDIFPAGRGRVLLVLMNQLANYQSKLDQINTNQKKFGDDVASTQATAAYKIHQAWASIQSDLTSFGEHVLPPLLAGVKGIAGAIDDVGKAFGRLSPETQKAIITGGLVVAAIGPAMRVASFFLAGMSKFAAGFTLASRMARGLPLKGGAGGGGGAGGAGAMGMLEVAEMTVGQMTVAELIGGGPGGMLGGPRGGGAPRGGLPPTGGPREPSVPGGRPLSAAEYRWMEGMGEYPGGRLYTGGAGVYDAKSGRFRSPYTGTYMKAGEAVTTGYRPGAMTLPGTYLGRAGGPGGFATAYGNIPGARYGAPIKGEATLAREATALEKPGMIARMGGLSGIAGGAMQGLGILGMAAFVAPIGFALTKALAGWINKDATKQGRDFADKITGPLGDRVGQHTKKQLTDSANAMLQLREDIRKTSPKNVAGGEIAPGFTLMGKEVQQDPAALARLQKDYFNVGWTTGKATVEGLSKAKFLTQPTLISDFQMQLNKIPPQSRVAAAQSMLQFAQGLVSKGKLPADEFRGIVEVLQSRYPELDRFLHTHGLETARDFGNLMKFDAAKTNLRNALQDMGANFGYLDVSTKIDVNNIWQNTALSVKHIKDDMQSTIPSVRRDATAEFHKLQQQVGEYMSGMANDVASKADSMSASLRTGSQKALAAATSNFNTLAGNIASAIATGTMAVSKGTSIMVGALNATLSAFGAAKVPVAAFKDLGSVQSYYKYVTQGGTAPGKAGTFAGGGVVTIGRPGERGGDNVPLQIMAGKGEKVAVFNAAQQAVMDQNLAHFGGLEGMFANVTQPHYATPRFAAGGLAKMIGTANAIDAKHYPYVLGGGHNGAFSGPYDCSGAVSAVLHSAGLLKAPLASAELASTFMKGPGVVTVYAHGPDGPTGHAYMSIGGRFFGTSNSNPGGGAGWFPGSARAGFVQRHVPVDGVFLRPPQILGKGTVPTLARGALRLETKAANALIAKNLPGGAFGGGDGGDFIAGGGQVANLAQLWIQAGGPPGYANIMAAIAMAESGGRNVIQQGQPYGSTGWGLWQITPGNSEPQFGVNNALLNPLNNAKAAVAKFRSGGLGQWTTYTSGAYRAFLRGGGGGTGGHVGGTFARGGFVNANRGLLASAAKAVHGTKPHAVSHKRNPTGSPTGHELASLGKAGQKVQGLESDIALWTARYNSLSSAYAAEEGSAQYLNLDGSLNPAGVTKKTQDDQALLLIATRLLHDYTAEVNPVTSELSQWLGTGSKTQFRINKIKSQLAKDTTEKANIHRAYAALSKPTKDVVGALQSSLRHQRLSWDPKVEAAVNAEKRFTPKPLPAVYTGKDKARKAANVALRAKISADNAASRRTLSRTVTDTRANEFGVLHPLQVALAAAQDDRRKHSDLVKKLRHKYQAQLAKLNAKDAGLRQGRGRLQSYLAGEPGASGTVGVNATISTLESVADKLGTVLWNNKGKFVGIDTSMEGAAFDEQTLITGLQNTLGTDATISQPAAADASLLAGFYQQIAQQAVTAAAISEGQLTAISGMPPFSGYGPPAFGAYTLPPYAGSFAQGGIVPGPFGAPRTAIVHGGEIIKAPDVNNNVKVLMEDHRTRVFVDDVEHVMNLANRRMTRSVTRRLAGIGGGG